MDSNPSTVTQRGGRGSEAPITANQSTGAEEESDVLPGEETWLETRKYDFLELWDRLKDFAWDPVNRTVLGRNKKSWGEIGVFYLIFYGSLAIFWAISLILFMETIPEIKEGPKYTNLIENPGMSASRKEIKINTGAAELRTSNMELLARAWYTNETEIRALESGIARACNQSTAGADDAQTLCVYLLVNRVDKWIPRRTLDITCTMTEENLQNYGSQIFKVVHSTFPLELFQPGQIHNFVPRDPVYRSPVTIVVFNLQSVEARGKISMTCSSKRSLLSETATFDLDWS